MPRILFSGLLYLILLPLVSRGQYIPLSNHYYDQLMQKYQEKNVSLLSSMKPILVNDLDTMFDIQHTLYPRILNNGGKNSFAFRKLFNEHLISYKTSDISITADPLFNFGIGYDVKEPKTSWINSRGLTLTGMLGNTLVFNSEIYENQAVLASWPGSFVSGTGVVPGQGATKPYLNNGVDYFYSRGYLSYSPSKYVNMTMGYGKNFIGDGYRSLLLSDVSFNYPYLKLTANFRKIKYTVLYSQFIDRSSTLSAGFGFDRKWSAMHYLEFSLGKRLNLGFFDAIIWENADSTGFRGFDIQYLNPVILLRPVEESFGSPDNALVGATFSYRISQHFRAYGQLLLDEFKLSHMLSNDGWWANKYGYQFGISGWNLFRIPALNARAEYNQARPYTYSHSTTIESYSHFSQPLAHPLGANFRELTLMADYQLRQWELSFKTTYAIYGSDTAGRDFGQNIFIPYDRHVTELGNSIGQGLKTQLNTTDLKIAYLLNPRTNMRIEAGISSRKLHTELSDQNLFLFTIGFRTSLFNIYDDF